MAFTIKVGSTRPAYVANLLDDFGLSSQKPLDLTSATSVTFEMRIQGSSSTPSVSGVMTVVNATQGQVQYTWITGDTSTAGTYDVEFKILWSDGGIERVPNGAVAPSFGTVIITPNLND